MSASTELQALLAALRPTLMPGDFVFVTQPNAKYGDGAELKPIAVFVESEGMTLVIPKDLAGIAGQQKCSGDFRLITLQVHSDLHAVGLTAAISGALASRGISANMVAAYHHDHLFVPSSCADEALVALNELSLAAGS